MEINKLRMLKEASFKFREAKRLEFQLHKVMQEGYTMLMKVVYPDYRTPQEMRAFEEGKPGTLGEQKDNADKLKEVKT